MSCNGNVYNIGMGCCEPMLGPVENYYTKPTIDRKLEEITSAITSGCCITPEQVDEKIEEAISGITVSGVTEEQLNEAIASVKTEIEAEIPTVPTSNTAFTNDAGYLTEHQSLTAYSTTQEVNTMIDEAVSGKQDTLIAGENITIVDNVISATGGGGGTDAPISAGTGTNSVKENYVNNVASGSYSHAEGQATKAYGTYSHAEGHSTEASGLSAHAEGELTNASGSYSHAEGTSTKANNAAAHAEGRSTTASGKYAHAEGMLTVASGQSAHAEGNSTRANGMYSHAQGDNTIANNESEHASGKYNVSNTGESTSAQTLFSVGNGGWDETAQDIVRHNAFEVRQNGDIYITKDGLDVKLQDQLGGGGGGNVHETPIYTIWENDFRDDDQSINARKAILDFQGDKSITTSTYVYTQILNKTSEQWYYPNATLNYVEGTYTKSQDDNNYLVVEYDSEIEDFIVSVSDDYPNAILFSVTFYSNKIKIESATIESGNTSDVIETSVANIFGDLYSKDLASVNMASLEIASPKNLRLVSQKKNGKNFYQNIKLYDLIATVNGADKTIKTDIKVPLGTSGWTEVNNISASTCNVEYLGEPLSFTSFRLTYNTNDMSMINLRLRAGKTNYSTAFFINWDSSQNKFVVSNEVFSATTITLDTTNHILTVELPATIEYGGTQGQTILFGLNSDRCQFGYSITKLEYYGEDTQDLIPYIQQLRSDVDSILNRLQNNS